MALKIVGGIAALIVLILIAGYFQPATFRYESSVLINAPAAKIYPYLETPKLFERWNPFMKTEPSAKSEFFGPENGVGAGSKFTSDSVEGTMTVTKTVPMEAVDYDLVFTRPFPGTNLTEFRVVAEGDGHRVSWAMSGESAYLPRVMGMFMSMQKMMTKTFDQGLNELKTIVESEK